MEYVKKNVKFFWRCGLETIISSMASSDCDEIHEKNPWKFPWAPQVVYFTAPLLTEKYDTRHDTRGLFTASQKKIYTSIYKHTQRESEREWGKSESCGKSACVFCVYVTFRNVFKYLSRRHQFYSVMCVNSNNMFVVCKHIPMYLYWTYLHDMYGKVKRKKFIFFERMKEKQSSTCTAVFFWCCFKKGVKPIFSASFLIFLFPF